MTEEEVIANLSKGCCSREKAAEAGCHLCVPRWEAVDEVKRLYLLLGVRRTIINERDESLVDERIRADTAQDKLRAAEVSLDALTAERDVLRTQLEKLQRQARVAYDQLFRASRGPTLTEHQAALLAKNTESLSDLQHLAVNAACALAGHRRQHPQLVERWEAERARAEKAAAEIDVLRERLDRLRGAADGVLKYREAPVLVGAWADLVDALADAYPTTWRAEVEAPLRALLDEVVRIAVDANLGIPQTYEEAVARLRTAAMNKKGDKQ